MQSNRPQRHSFKMTVAGGGQQDQEQFAGDDVPPARPIRTTSYLSSAGGCANIRPPEQQPLRLSGGSTNQLGNKDLIIRMLAEIFQVRHDEHTGQVRWQQVSMSLVPISLYSRTTSRWLDYLLETAQAHDASCSTTKAAASAMQQVNDPVAQTMSPDSRDFLLQLQQFHHQQQQQQHQIRATSRGANNLDPRRAHLAAYGAQAQQDPIVFQVVGHDFLDGQCRKILNVKIRQPGVRLGQASDYFVYWRELAAPCTRLSNHHYHLNHQQFSASSFADSSIQSAYPPAIQMLNPTECPGRGQPIQTWGLNFASTNDAKLFYDICSLNLVNLDFNSDYLKQLTSVSDTRQLRNNKAYTLGSNSYMLNSPRNNTTRRVVRHSSRTGPLNARQAAPSGSSSSIRQGGVATGQSKSPLCRQAFEMSTDGRKQRQVSGLASAQRINTGGGGAAAAGSDAIADECPVHGNRPASGIRLRSRSTTRQPLASEHKDSAGVTSMRARSFSTPASPEPTAEACPVHRKGPSHRVGAQSSVEQQQRPPFKLPEKPARGLLRSPYSSSQEKYNGEKYCATGRGGSQPQPPPVPQHSQDLRALHTKRNTKTRYMGYLHTALGGRRQEQQQQQQQLDDPARQQQHQQDNRSLFEAAETFEAISRKDARLARARYANSRNMKEFLSLDAGGQLPAGTPSLQRLQTMRTQRAAAAAAVQNELLGLGLGEQRTTKKSVVQSKSIDKSLGQTRPERRLPAKPSAAGESNDIKGHVSGLGGSGHCSVSTTTEDLPMDTTIKKRMLKLTSQEVISEASEPRSAALASMSTVVEHGDGADRSQVAAQVAANCAGWPQQAAPDQRQVRAISLGPQASARGGRGGGPSARSDAGRRRSLERSVRIDQDPASSLMKFAARLSPLAQSNAPSPLEATRTSPQPATYGPEESTEVAPNYSQSQDLDAGQRRHECRSGGGSSISAATLVEARGELANAERAGGAQLDYADQQQHVRLFAGTLHDANDASECGPLIINHAQMASHKSAPDIGRLMLASACDGHDGGECCKPTATAAAAAAARSHKHGHFVNMSPWRPLANNLPNMSSYAVPLCATIKRPPVPSSADDAGGARQCRSCPNSLRRKRRAPPPPPPPLLPPVDFSQYCSCQQHSLGAAHLSPAAGLVQICRNSAADCFVCCNTTPAQLHLRQTTCCQYQHHHHHHHHLYHGQPAPDDQPTTRIGRYDTLKQAMFAPGESGAVYYNQIAANPHVLRPHVLRPHSSQSVLSPTKFGLYESEDSSGGQGDECDGDQAEHEENLFLAARLPVQFGNPMQQHQQHSRDYYDERARAPAYCPTAALKPVPGYDRTLARVRIKSKRQRSKSQPPSGDSADVVQVHSAVHLTKSMENVEKLIKEVQSELRALKRQPLLGTAEIGMRQQQQQQAGGELSNQTNERGPPPVRKQGPANRASPEVSREQQTQAADSSRHNETGNTNGQRSVVSLTSATRRAGQFKCVGAIRKAGFLSVKKWILKRRQSIELARKQGWKCYWVCLRGTALLFHSVIEDHNGAANGENGQQQQQQQQHQQQRQDSNQTDLLSWIRANCSGQLSVLNSLLATENVGVPSETFLKNMSQCFIEKEPRHLIIIDGAVAQPIPEHPRRDFVFCLSTTFGDAYLFQASCQLESDSWISAIHNACAASIARELVRDEAIKLFETKIKHFELEAEKKLFLRQRLESRLTSMSSMCCYQQQPASDDTAISQADKNHKTTTTTTTTMRSLLFQLSQQLLALDTYIEQLHCEVYQLRCYLSSCSGQNQIFYQQQAKNQNQNYHQLTTGSIQNELPNPKSLLMHVSKPTKLLLIKLGVFAVSSFHAYIHARQDSAQSMLLQTIQHQQHQDTQSPLVELRIRSRSISETLVARTENAKLASETENLIKLADIKTVHVMIGQSVLETIRSKQQSLIIDDGGVTATATAMPTSDDRYSIESRGNSGDLLVSVKMNSSSTSSSIIKQVLKILTPHATLANATDESEFLNYYLRLVVEVVHVESNVIDGGESGCSVVVKRGETLADWTNYAHLELLEKVIFRVELTRSRVDEEESSAPFGVSVEGQLIRGEQESFLNVFCSYIEWGSVADKAGLQDDDEFLMVNGVPLADLDLMFVECIIQEASKLKLVVRSNRIECPARARRLERTTWRSLDDDDNDPEDPDDSDNPRARKHKERDPFLPAQANLSLAGVTGAQVISNEYLTSLVCPPPPACSSAFLRSDTYLLRQKSDLSVDKLERYDSVCMMSKAKSQHRIDSLDLEAPPRNPAQNVSSPPFSRPVSSANLARQLLKRSERLTRLLGVTTTTTTTTTTITKEPTNPVVVVRSGPGPDNLGQLLSSAPGCALNGSGNAATQNQVERLQKSILELIETEYAYIRHLETISEHYMAPLCESSFLGILDLRDFNASLLALLRFQQAFFGRLMDCIFEKCRLDFAYGVHQSVARDHFERFNKIVQHTESISSIGVLEPMLDSIARTFTSEADKFRVYAGYCASYSKLQRILHPKSASASPGKGAHCAITITSAPMSMNTFQTSALGLTNISELANCSTGGRSRQADFKQLTFDTGNWKLGATVQAAVLSPEAQLRKLAEFLGSLDSSSSSASFSLPRSSSLSEARSNEPLKSTGGSPADAADVPAGAAAAAAASQSYQKSVHQQNFESYLIKPIQRIVKYPMLLNCISLAANVLLAQPNDDLRMAIKQIETVINHVNDAQRAHDEYGPILAHIQRQFIEQLALDLHQRKGSHRGIYASSLLFGHHQPPISLSLAQLLYFGPVEWLNLNEFTPRARKVVNANEKLQCALFVFESCVVFLCKEFAGKSNRRKMTLRYDAAIATATATATATAGANQRVPSWSSASASSNSGEHSNAIVRYQTLIPVSEVQVRSVPTSSSTDGNQKTTTRFEWELFQCSSSNSNSSLLTSAAVKSVASVKREQKQNQQKVYLLSSETNEQRSAFLRKIRLTIRDSVRNMSLPPVVATPGNRSPTSSQNRSPPTTSCSKKLSSSSASSVTLNGGAGGTHNSITNTTSLSPPESSGGGGLAELAANGSGQKQEQQQEQQASATTNIKCLASYPRTRQNETSIEINT